MDKTIEQTREIIEDTIDSLIHYCRENNWAGWDPYDALNSRVFDKLKFLHSRWPRLILTQGMKRSPINFRKILGVPKTHNPKGIALFISSLVRLSGNDGLYDEDIRYLIDLLFSLRSPGEEEYCWGYNFDWQQRINLVPKFSPNIICTTFAGNALLDAYEHTGDDALLNSAKSACTYIIDNLLLNIGSNEVSFIYIPELNIQSDNGNYTGAVVHNANLLGSAFIARLFTFTKDKKQEELALHTADYSVKRQHSNGSWSYGTDSTQGWVDNFHTGYNLIALKTISESILTDMYTDNIKLSFDFFVKNFFEGPIAKYYNDNVYPIDIHSVSQSIITLVAFHRNNGIGPEFPLSVFRWAFTNMRSSGDYFYFQKQQLYTNKIPYMRWSQGWMLYAMSELATYDSGE